MALCPPTTTGIKGYSFFSHAMNSFKYGLQGFKNAVPKQNITVLLEETTENISVQITEQVEVTTIEISEMGSQGLPGKDGHDLVINDIDYTLVYQTSKL
jgi:ketopantoate hydroxymethyltransferase